ncbi:MAG: ABC transporter permease [Microgenomates group bacterium]
MNLFNTFTIALKAIAINKLRSFLTTLGVIIGVGSVVLLTSIGNGLSAYVTEQFDALGANTVLVFPGDPFGENGGFNQEEQLDAVTSSKLRLSDVREIEGIREHVIRAVPFIQKVDTMSFQTKEERVTIIGTTYDYTLSQGNAELAKGSFFTNTDDESGKRVVAIGHSIAEELFGEVDPVGKKVKIGTQSFTVVGVMEEVGGSFGGPSFDTYAFMPLETATNIYDIDSLYEIIVKVKDSKQIPEAIIAIEKVLGERLEEDEFSVFDQSDILNTINEILGVLTLGLGGIASISLVVGGIGIMNIMLVSVTERTREIGLRKALGATPNSILAQFLIEAAILSLLGGIIGIVIAFLGTLAIQPYFPAKVTMDAVVLAFGVSTLVGLIFGAAPARRAAQLSPIEALRYE